MARMSMAGSTICTIDDDLNDRSALSNGEDVSVAALTIYDALRKPLNDGSHVTRCQDKVAHCVARTRDNYWSLACCCLLERRCAQAVFRTAQG